MTKTELQIALATATQTNKRIAGVFLDTLCNLTYKAIKKNAEFVLPGFGKLAKQKRKARTGVNPNTLATVVSRLTWARWSLRRLAAEIQHEQPNDELRRTRLTNPSKHFPTEPG